MTWTMLLFCVATPGIQSKIFLRTQHPIASSAGQYVDHATTGSNGDYYICFVWIYDWKTYQHILAALDNLLITG